MSKIWVFVLSAISFCAGAFCALAYQGAKLSMEGMRAGCELLETAEATKLMTKQQRADVVDHTFARINGSSPPNDMSRVTGPMKYNCPALRKL